MENLKKLIQKTWDGDISFEDATQFFNQEELSKMESTIENNVFVFLRGVPFIGDDEKYDALLQSDEGAKLIQKMIDFMD